MQYDVECDAQQCSIRFHNQRRLVDCRNFLVAAIVFTCALLARETERFVLGAAAFSAVFVFLGIKKIFEKSSLIIEPDFLTLDRRLFGIGSTRKFPKSEVERLGYEPEFKGYRSHQDSALAIMVRNDIMPVRFAQTIVPSEAQAIFDNVKQHGSWLAELIRPVGTPMF